MRTRLLAVAAVAALGAALPVSAAPAPQITDPTGDALTQEASADIVSALFRTEGSTTKVGRKSVYTPSKLLVDVTYAAAPSTDPHVAHVLTFNAPGCGVVYLEVFMLGTWGVADCLPDTDFEVSYKINGNTLTYTLPFTVVGKQYFKPGSSLTDLVAYTAASEPTVGVESVEVVSSAPVAPPVNGAIDHATTKTAFKI